MTWAAIAGCLTRGDDLRSAAAHAAFETLIRQEGPILSVGGGPRRIHPRLHNLNITFADGVDVVGNAYALPVGDASLAGIHCEAVLEHLEFPDTAVGEMFRALRPGGVVFAATPFLQPYHAYPDHYQNFTLRGHTRLFERAGFTVRDAGTCVGPTFALVDILANYVRELTPGRVPSRILERLVRAGGRIVRLPDVVLRHHRAAAHLASSTFVLAEKTVDVVDVVDFSGRPPSPQ